MDEAEESIFGATSSGYTKSMAACVKNFPPHDPQNDCSLSVETITSSPQIGHIPGTKAMATSAISTMSMRHVRRIHIAVTVYSKRRNAAIWTFQSEDMKPDRSHYHTPEPIGGGM